MKALLGVAVFAVAAFVLFFPVFPFRQFYPSCIATHNLPLVNGFKSTSTYLFGFGGWFTTNSVYLNITTMSYVSSSSWAYHFGSYPPLVPMCR